ncbi:MAG: hypothetical protein AB8B49_03505 [Nitratireductor sp.]
MGRRSAEAEENHWPGFVDALSTIVMVVTFLLIILAVAIFVIAQNVAKSNIESQASKSLQGGGDKSSIQNMEASVKAEGPEKAETVVTAAAAPKVSEDESDFKPELAEETTAEEPIEAETELALLSRKTEIKEERIVIAPAEREEIRQKSKVITSSSVLTLEFDDKSTKIDEGSSDRIKSFLNEDANSNKDARLTIWSFANSKQGSVSEAKRIAYYRALSARNEFLGNGYKAENIAVEVRFAPKDDEKNTVRVVLQP